MWVMGAEVMMHVDDGLSPSSHFPSPEIFAILPTSSGGFGKMPTETLGFSKILALFFRELQNRSLTNKKFVSKWMNMMQITIF
jgi:hypothetical protein